jgi:hypothetical protein
VTKGETTTLLVPIRKPARRKALLAIAFAGGTLNSQLPALCESKSESTDSVIQQIANSTQITPEARAYYFLRLASRYLAGDDRAANSRLNMARISDSFSKFET